MRRVLAFACLAACAFSATAANAADMRRGPPSPDFFPATPVPAPSLDAANGWYLRGDIGYRWNAIGSAQAAAGFTSPGNNSLSGGFWGGIGAGFKFGAWRTDFTIDTSAPMKYRGDVVTPGDATATVRAFSGLLNLYYDIGTWERFTPYLGVGIGRAYVRTSDFSSTAVPPLTAVPSYSRWNVSWALMAGASFALTRTVLVDAGYRYRDLGDAETERDISGRLSLRRITAQEVRVGLRWVIPAPEHLR